MRRRLYHRRGRVHPDQGMGSLSLRHRHRHADRLLDRVPHGNDYRFSADPLRQHRRHLPLPDPHGHGHQHPAADRPVEDRCGLPGGPGGHVPPVPWRLPPDHG